MRLSDLEVLIVHWGTIHGRAFDPSAVTISASTGEGQSALEYASDHGLSRALRALSALQTMARSGAEGKRSACVLLYWAGCAPSLRKSGQCVEEIGRSFGKGKRARERGERLLLEAMWLWEAL